MAEKEPAYWPDIDVRRMTNEEWLALKRRVARETGLERARVADEILRRLFAHHRRAPVALSPTEPAALPAGARPR